MRRTPYLCATAFAILAGVAWCAVDLLVGCATGRAVSHAAMAGTLGLVAALALDVAICSEARVRDMHPAGSSRSPTQTFGEDTASRGDVSPGDQGVEK